MQWPKKYGRKRTKNDLQNTTKKSYDCATRAPLSEGGITQGLRKGKQFLIYQRHRRVTLIDTNIKHIFFSGNIIIVRTLIHVQCYPCGFYLFVCFILFYGRVKFLCINALIYYIHVITNSYHCIFSGTVVVVILW